MRRGYRRIGVTLFCQLFGGLALHYLNLSNRRENRNAKADLQLAELSSRLNQYNLKTKEKIEQAIKKATKGASDLFQIQLIEDKQIVQRQIGPGKPGPNTRYKEEENISYRLEWELDHKAIKDLASRDGIFPLITNGDIDAAEVLKAYKNQPQLKKSGPTSYVLREQALCSFYGPGNQIQRQDIQR